MAPEQRPVNLAEYRQVQSRSEDPRTRSTRTRIISAFERLSASEESVTVNAIVRTAGISRASFYTHFAGVDELALALQQQVIERIGAWQQREPHRQADAAPGDHRESVEAATRMLVRYFATRRALYAQILSGPSSSRARDELIDAIAAAVEGIAHHSRPQSPVVDLRLQALQVAGALTTLIVRWLRGDLECDEESLVRSHLQLQPAWMRHDES